MTLDYAIISNDQNPEYVKLFPYIKERWNDLGIKTIYVDCTPWNDQSSMFDPIDDMKFTTVDDFGNLEISVTVPKNHWDGDKWFPIMIYRFLIATHKDLYNKVLIISDGDLFPINKKYIYKPSYDIDMEEIILSHRLVCTNQYPNGDHLATYTYGLGSTFHSILDTCRSIIGFNTELGVKRLNLDHVLNVNKDLCKLSGKYYVNDEVFMNYLYKLYFIVKHGYSVRSDYKKGIVIKDDFKDIHSIDEVLDMFKYRNQYVVNTCNRKWIEMVQEMNNLYYFQIKLLERPQDLAPFIEMHNMRASETNEEDWNKLFSLLKDFDKMEITPNNYFWTSIKNPWRDTRVTKEGIVMLGDEYD